MIVYRPVRGSLKESMKEVKEFNNEEEMKKYIVKQWDNSFSVEDMVITDTQIDDDRIGWGKVKHVCTKRFGNQDNIALYGTVQCIGMCTEKK